ncbi:ATP-binding protein, partial [Salmonella enterica subsp. enterica serovar Typhimurium]|nr:ATP-binding protein [Salmonella enterica subsp. enterica serovar Typhimurium]
RDEAEAASGAKAAFLATMSHEIRTPMNGIIGMTDMVLSEPLSDEQRENLGWVKSSADSLMGILNDILDLSKIEADRLQLEEVPFSVLATLDRVRSMMADRIASRRLLLKEEVDPRLTGLSLLGDPMRVGQILINYLSNAVKFTERGSVDLSVTLDRQDEGVQGLRFAVRDTGIGIPADKQALIFDAFSQADSSTTRRFGGTGLGLAICTRLVKRMGGRLDVI